MVVAFNVAYANTQQPVMELFISNNFFLLSLLVIGMTISWLVESQFRNEFLLTSELEKEKARSDGLLGSIFPPRVVDRLKSGGTYIADSHGEATVLFADLVGFSSLTKQLAPQHLVEFLNDLFSEFDTLVDRYRLEKIKTIGDSYMLAGGATENLPNHAEHVADFALDLLAMVEEYAARTGHPLDVRIGIATGHVISGVIGRTKYSYDLWGDTVNLASRMESHGESGQIQITEATYWRLFDHYVLEARGEIDIKNMGRVQTYWLKAKNRS